MDPRYKSRFTTAMRAEAAARFGADPGSLIELDGFESFIYEFTRAGQPRILRIGHSNRRPAALVRGEVEWINYLASGGVPAARADLSLAGSLVELIDDGQGEQFVAAAFEKAPGRGVRHTDSSPALFRAWGRLLGRSHALSAHFRPVYPRPHWDDPIMLFADSMLPPSESIALARYHELLAHLGELPRDDLGCYGMIHQDAHAGNMFLSGAAEDPHLTLFDFDDCCYSWYANDIAIVLFYVSMGWPDRTAFTREFMSHFLPAYRAEMPLDPAWLLEIPNFLKLREIDLYAVIHRSFDVSDLSGDPWVENYMRGRKERIEAGAPYLDFDFAECS